MSVIKSVKKWVNMESKRSGKNKALVLLNVVGDYLRYGVNPKEYYWFHFDGKTDAQKKTFFNKKMFNRLIKRNNDPAFVQILNDKYIFSKTYAEFTCRKCIRTGRNMDLGALKDFLQDTERFVYKPVDGSGGSGIQAMTKHDYPSVDALAERLQAMPDGVLEQWIRQHPEMTKPYPHAVNCIRIASLMRDGRCNILGATLTFGRDGIQVSNAFLGSVFALVDVKTGRVISDFCTYHDEKLAAHPDTGVVARGFQIPYWPELLEMISRAAAIVPQVGYVGWDVAIGEDGPVLIEGNSISAGYTGYQHYLARSDGRGSRAIWEPFIH